LGEARPDVSSEVGQRYGTPSGTARLLGGRRGGERVEVICGEERVEGAEAVEGAVPGGFGSALGGFGAGREPGVAGVGLDLALRHSTPRLQSKPEQGGC